MINIFVKLRVPDLVAITAKQVLTKNMKVKGLVDIKREDWWQISILSKNKNEMVSRVKEIVDECPIFVNPNKHTYYLQTSYPQSEVINGIYAVYVGVWDYDDNFSLSVKKILQEQFSYKEIEDVKKGVLWILKIESKNIQGAREIAHSIANSSARTSGLLSNPHINYYKVF